MSTTVISPDLRLSRRGRLLLRGLPVLLLVALTAVAAVVFGSMAWSPAAASPDRAAAVETVTVGYGDTLWSIAGRAAPDADRIETISRIGELNGLQTSDLEPGQMLFLPGVD